MIINQQTIRVVIINLTIIMRVAKVEPEVDPH
jgi:hypothetical protein